MTAHAGGAAAAVRLLRAASAVLGGERAALWALNDPAPTRNPWAPDRTPGGSSAGSAVAGAAGMCTATVDTQTAGDVLRPAAYNAVVGFKPTIGWVSTDGSQPVAPAIDTIGVTARRVDDAAAVAAAIADDPARFSHGAVSGLPRLGLLADPFADDIGPVMRANFSETLQQLADADAKLARCPARWIFRWCTRPTASSPSPNALPSIWPPGGAAVRGTARVPGS